MIFFSSHLNYDFEIKYDIMYYSAHEKHDSMLDITFGSTLEHAYDALSLS